MGSEQSSRREREERNYNYNRAPAATTNDLEKALEQQRKLYEQRIKDLLQESKQESGAASLPSRPVTTTEQQRQQSTLTAKTSAVTTENVKKAQEQRSKMYEQGFKDLLRSGPTSGAIGPLSSLVTNTGQQSQQSTSTVKVESLRPPSCYNQERLHVPFRDPNRNLYPNLNSGVSPSSPSLLSAPNYNTVGGNNNGGPSAFVFVNRAQPAQRYRPSAPPAETSSTNFRSRSRSRQRGPDEDITCPTCKKMFGDKIYQCNQGHSSCNLCKTRQVPCGQCRQQLTNCRNFELEKYVLEKKVVCPNSADGCRLHIKLADMEAHAKECPFKALKCPSLGSCQWIGKLSHLAIHFDAMHPTHHRQGEVDTEMFLSNICDTSHTMHFIRIGNFNFLFHIKVSETDHRIYMAAQLIGTKHSATKWNYEVHMYKKSEPRRKFQYIDRCVSDSEPIEDIVKSTKCVVIPVEYAKTFICNGVLAYKFYIKKDEVQPKEFVKKKGRGPRRD